MKNLLARFFSDIALVCGHEKTLHAAFCHQLLLRDPKVRFVQEYRLSAQSRERTDVVVFSGPAHFDNGIAEMPHIAIEFKGGAYGNRNALYDTVDADGHCADLDKLLPYRKQGLECWFVCVDAEKLGISLSTAARKRLAGRCAQLGINFAYHAQNEPTFLVGIGTTLEQCPLAPKAVHAGIPVPRLQECLASLPRLLLGRSASEDTYTALAYHGLRVQGFAAEQLSLETYFNCATQGSRMAKRPDLCVFSSNVGGHFNLYRGGRRDQSNDGIKLKHLQAVIEVKGGTAAERLTDNAFARQIRDDIDKLADWRTCFQATGHMDGARDKCRARFVMLAIDNRPRPLSVTALAALRQQAAALDIDLCFIGQ